MSNPSTQSVGTRPSNPVFWNDPFYRSIFVQFVAFVLVVLAGKYLFDNTVENMAKQGIASGFNFLGTTAGFNVTSSLIEYDSTSTYGRAFWVGLLNTLMVSGVSIFFATILGFIIGIARLSNNWLIAKIATVYIEVLRNIPLLLQIFFWYFAVLRPLPSPRESIEMFNAIFINNRGLYLPSPNFEDGSMWILMAFIAAIVAIVFTARWSKKRHDEEGKEFPLFSTSIGLLVGLPFLALLGTGFPVTWGVPSLQGFNFQGGMVIIPEFVALAIALSTYTAAFIAEVVRAGIQSVSTGQTEAASALGLKSGQVLRFVTIPQALRVIIPPLTNQYLNLAKNSSLAAAIAYPDLVLVFAGTVLMQTGQAVEIIFITMAMYLLMSLVISLFMNWYNKRIELVER